MDKRPRLLVPSRALLSTARVDDCVNLIRDTVSLLSQDVNITVDLSLGDPTRFNGGFSPPVLFKRELARLLDTSLGDGYFPASGHGSARRALAERYGKTDENDVFVTSGCSQAIDLALRGLAGPGDLVFSPVPGFPLYENLIGVHGMDIARYVLDPKENWQVDFESLMALDSEDAERVKVVIVCNPSNPCGSVFSRKHCEDILKCIKFNYPNAVVLADQVYEDVVFDKDHAEFVDLGTLGQELGVSVVAVSGLSKGFHAPGYRVGWTVCYDARPHALDGFRKRMKSLCATSMGASSLFQLALPALLNRGNQEMIEFRNRADTLLKTSRDIFVKGLKSICEFQVPRGAMYIFFKFPLGGEQDSFTICQDLVRLEGLLLLPGDVCFHAPPGYVRCLIAVPEDVARDVVMRIQRYCEQRKR